MSKETPYYQYDLDLLNKTLIKITEEAQKFNFRVHYALKANSNTEILNLINSYNLGADCVSGNEITRALEIGFPNSKIVFAGVGKSDKEIETGLNNNIECFNCESLQEIEVINEIGKRLNKKAKIALRINPNVDANTHKYITTGLLENKFGINFWELESALNLIKKCSNITLVGLHFHIGSQILDLDVFKKLCIRINEIQSWFREREISIKILNVGGGLGINYLNPDENLIPEFEKYFSIFNEFLDKEPEQEVHFELGRSIVGQCGSLISKVLYLKEGKQTDFLILDAGITELIRPALYNSVHKITNLSSKIDTQKLYDIVGPVCESSDSFGKKVSLPISKRGDIIEIKSTGAYGESMQLIYNMRDKTKAYYNKK